MFTVLFPDDQSAKDDIIENIFNNEKIVNTKNYKEIKLTYERAYWHLQNKIFYDFFKFRKQLKKYTKFKILSTLQNPIEIEQVKSNTTIFIDSSIKQGNKKLEIENCTVKEAKKIIFDKLGISCSKQEIYKNDELLNNSTFLKNECVTLKQKRRSNSKK